MIMRELEVEDGNRPRQVSGHSEMLDLQWQQLTHDERYHRDILSLSVPNRIRHMTLHFSKYAGLLVDIEAEDTATIDRVIVDCFIIALASANTLSLDLQRVLCMERLSLSEFGEMSAKALARPVSREYSWFLQRLVQHTGRMAKACESLDHLENVAFHEMLANNVVSITRIVLAEAASRSKDLKQLMRDRLDKVERKNLFWPCYVARDEAR